MIENATDVELKTKTENRQHIRIIIIQSDDYITPQMR